MKPQAKIPVEFYLLLPKFVKKYLPENVPKFDVQEFLLPCPFYPKGLFGYFEKKRGLTQADWIFHFYLSPKELSNKVSASLSLSGLDQNKTIRWISIDIDDKAQMDVWREKLQPLLDGKEIEYFIEWGGDQDDSGDWNRCHVLIFFDSVSLELATDFTKQLFYDIGEPAFPNEVHHFPGKDKILFDEIFPINKPKNKIRPPYGYHKKRERRYPCEYKGESLDNSLLVMQAIIDIKPITDWQIQAYVNPKVKAILGTKLSFRDKVTRTLEKKRYKFFYEPLNLPLPVDNIPNLLIPVVKNCQAIHTLLEDTAKAGFINTAGNTHHKGQLALRGITKYIDAQYRITDGEEFYNYLRSEYRFRDDESHQLERNEHDDNPVRYFTNCEKWHELFGLCNGCKFQGRILSPRQFIKGQVVKRELLKRVKLSTLDDIRLNEFPKLTNELVSAVECQTPKTILYAHSQGSGKSYSIVRKSIIRLVKNMYKVLVAVPSTDLALEYKEALALEGIDCFILSSHKAMFDPKRTKRLTDQLCPFYEEMQELDRLGVSSSLLKSEYCANCPLKPTCPYPTQYVDVQEKQHKVVIIQHAHFSCQEVIFKLMDKNFDVLYVDESFIDSIFKFMPILEKEIIALRDLGKEWSDKLADWLDCKTDPKGKLEPDDIELGLAKAHFDSLFLKWHVPDYVRFHNQRRLVNPTSGIEVIYELPDLPIKVFTDATPPIELIKHLTGITNIEVKGADSVLDVKAIHPENEVIQVLDFNSSVTWLENEETLNLILDKIADKVREHPKDESKHLITAYLKDHHRIESYFRDNHTDCLRKIQLGAITKGVNKYADFDQQFILANILFLGRDYLMQTYKYIQVANFYRKKKGLAPLPNTYPKDLTVETRIPTSWEAVERIENNKLVLYPQFKIPKPPKGLNEYDENYWFRLIYDLTVGQVQQAIRVRLTSDKPRTIHILNNNPLPSTSVTRSMTLDGWLNS